MGGGEPASTGAAKILEQLRPRIIRRIVIAVYVIAGVVVLVAIWTVLIFNHLIRLGNEAKRGWSNIDVQLKRRTDLIPNLVEAVKGYAAHERQVFEDVTAARTAMQQASGPAQAGEANKQASAAIGRLFAVSEAYPQLRASENFQKLQEELTDTEDKIAAARRYYNQTVYQYNTRLQSFPDLIVAKLGGFHEREFFALDSPAEAGLPNVDFSGDAAPQ
jgi:LemA protein